MLTTRLREAIQTVSASLKTCAVMATWERTPGRTTVNGALVTVQTSAVKQAHSMITAALAWTQHFVKGDPQKTSGANSSALSSILTALASQRTNAALQALLIPTLKATK